MNAVVIRKVADTMRDSVYAQMMWAIDILGVSAEFHGSVSPMEIVYKPTGQRILFRGCDKPEKLKSIKLRSGYIGLIWFEELDQFYGMNEIRNILQSLMRGGERFSVFYTYNPPKSRDNWVNREVLTHRDDRIVHTSSYLEVPRHWLGEQFYNEADELQAANEAAYRHEYLGDITGTGGAVFENITIRTIADDEAAEFDRLYNGVDFGFFPDPWILVRCHYAAAQRTLYIFDEASAIRASNAQTSEIIKQHLGQVRNEAGEIVEYARKELVVCDSASPQNIAEYRNLNVDARPVKKGPGSVEFGVKWLQGLHEIVIDPARCPTAATEFQLYEYERTRDGEYCSQLPDRNNHAIDATRYAMTPAFMRFGDS